MKKTLTYIACAILALSTVSCAKVGFSEPEPVGDGVTIQFLTTDLTKAGVDGIGNENKVNKIDWFVFPFKEDGSAVDSTATALLDGTIVPASGAQLDLSYSATLTSAQINTIFPTAGSRALVFAVANYTGTYPETYTLKGLLALEVGNTFADGDRWPHPLKTNDAMLNFVMTGAAEISLTAAQTKVELNRLASKVTVSFTYKEEIIDAHDANLVWKPQYNGPEARVYLSNAIATATLGGPLTSRAYVPDSKSAYEAGTRDIFEYSYDYLKQLAGDPVYYTYPTKMKAGDDNQPYLKLVLPWYAYDKRDTNPNAAPVKQKEVYYKIALPLDALQESNRYYEYKVHVDIIGSDTEVEIAATYSIFNWWNKGKISSNIATGKYISLDIPKNEYDMYSELLQILYVASGDVELIVDEISQDYLGSATTTSMVFMQNNAVQTNRTISVNGQNVNILTYKGISGTDVSNWVSLDEDNRILQINHEMNNQMTTSSGAGNTAFDMAPYVYTITLHLKDAGTDTTFDRTITVTQYPSLYVKYRRSNGYAFVNNWDNQRTGDRICYDDRGQNNNARLGNFSYRYNETMTGNNRNPNNYLISVSTLPEGSNYLIGDPRSREIDNLSNLGGLSKYKPTQESGTENMIAPKIIVASSYGVITSSYWFNKETAVKRCAAYQENGYPAGRWRVPTAAEIMFMMTLSNKGFIPSLFNLGAPDRQGYWCANGKISGDDNGLPYLSDDTQTTAVRCVYDAWYWGEDPVATGTAAQSWLGFQD